MIGSLNRIINFKEIINAGYKSYDHIKIQVINENSYDSLYILDKDFSEYEINNIKNKLFNDNSYGKILRLKGFIFENNNWYEINLTKDESKIDLISDGQKVLIVIGESLNKDKIKQLFG